MKIQKNIKINSFARKLKGGPKYFSQLNWGFPSGLHISVAASVLGVAGLILALKDGKLGCLTGLPISWSSNRDNNASDDDWLVPGLQNLGNNCFLNVILQGLASCSSFREFVGKALDESAFSSAEERVENMPLAANLFSLLEELCTIQHKRVVLSPANLMLAMSHYSPNFNLTSQQDAEEAFFHLLSSLRGELSECYIPEDSTLAEVTALSNSRIVAPGQRGEQTEQERWQQSFIGPFNGILGSILTCQSCSFQISLDFQLFHSLHIVPLLGRDATIVTRCSIEDCLRQFFVAERLENYSCSSCWHVAAVKYISALDGDKTVIEKLKHCNKEDSCDCKSIFSLRALPWANSFSHTFKQLSIASCPKILCIHLQRSSVNVFGDLVKVQGHVSFPLILDISPFVASGAELRKLDQYLQIGQSRQQNQHSFHLSNHLNILNSVGEGGRSRASEVEIARLKQHASALTADSKFQSPMSELHPHEAGGYMHEVGGTSSSVTSKGHMYLLVSVVQHFGRVGSGHYIVYRRVKTRISEDSPAGLSEPTSAKWFCISDSEVHCVSEKDVLDAEASVLFYEKI